MRRVPRHSPGVDTVSGRTVLDVLRAVDAEAIQPEELADALAELTRLEVLFRHRATAPPTTNGTSPSRLDQYLTVQEVADRLAMSAGWVNLNKRKLGGVKLSGKALRIPEKSVLRFLAGRRRSP